MVDKRALIFLDLETAIARFSPTSVFWAMNDKQKLDNMKKGIVSDHKNIANLSSYVLGNFYFIVKVKTYCYFKKLFNKLLAPHWPIKRGIKIHDGQSTNQK